MDQPGTMVKRSPVQLPKLSRHVCIFLKHVRASSFLISKIDVSLDAALSQIKFATRYALACKSSNARCSPGFRTNAIYHIKVQFWLYEQL